MSNPKPKHQKKVSASKRVKVSKRLIWFRRLERAHGITLVILIVASIATGGLLTYRSFAASNYPTSCEGRAGTSGCIDTSKLCTIDKTVWNTAKMDCSAAPHFRRMATAFEKKFKKKLLTSSQLKAGDKADNDFYRSLAAQITCYKNKPNVCAKPGTSNHGYGIAVDLGSGVNIFNSPENKWIWENRCYYYFDNPYISNHSYSWRTSDAKRTSGTNEAWHWEYRPQSCE